MYRTHCPTETLLQKNREASTTFIFNTSDGLVIQKTSQQEDESGVHYKDAESQHLRISRHAAINGALSQDVQNWQGEVKLSDNYSRHHEEFADILSEFQTVRISHLFPINVEKQRIKHLHYNVQPVHFSPYRAGPRTRDFEEIEFEEMIEQKVIESARTE